MFNLLAGETRFDSVRAADAVTPLVQMYLYDEIGPFGVTPGDFVAELMPHGSAPVDLHVSSPGGDVFDGIAILNSLRAYPGRVTAYVDGIAASAASFVIMGADEVVMGGNAELMIHDAWGLCMGDAADMRDAAATLERVSDNIADIYASKTAHLGTGQHVAAEWRRRMRDETWYSAEQAVDAGLADRVAGRVTVGASYDLSRFNNRPAAGRPVPPQDGPPPVAPATDELSPAEWATVLRAFEEAL